MIDYSGQRLGNYRLVRLLGQGAFAEVYLGKHIYLETEAAIKLLHTHLASQDVEQFRTEAQVIARLVHPNIVRVLEFGVEKTTPFLVMDYAPGGTLRQRHPKGSRLPLETVVSYVQQIAPALQYAHERKLIHRDIKPENLLVSRTHEILLSDFGIALVAQNSHSQSTQNMAGTIAYMAPEQINGHPRLASDQYSLGIMVYEWLSGDRPFHGSFTEIAAQQNFMPPPSLQGKLSNISSAVDQVVLKALAKDPQQRFESVTHLAQALASAAEPRPEPVRDQYHKLPTPLPHPKASSSAPVSRRTIIVTGASVGVVMLGGGIYWFATSSHSKGTTLTTTTGHSSLTATPTPLPLGAILFTYRGHTNYVWSVAWSPDSKRIASASRDHTVQIWNADGSDSPFIYRGHTNSVESVAWSPDGKRIASASADNTVQIWNVDGSSAPFTYKGHVAYVLSAAWSPDGTRIASASWDKTVQVWNVDGSGSPFTYKGHTNNVESATWSPDGKRIASASDDKTAQVWNADGSGAPFTYNGHTNSVLSVAWSPDGQHIASASADNTVQVWNADGSGSPFTYKGHTNVVLSVAWSPDGKRIASASQDYTVQVWNADGSGSPFTYKGHTNLVVSVAWSPDGKRIASASDDKTVQVWEAG